MSHAYMLTSESVTEGHPDKLCDQISDAIVDHALRVDPQGRIMSESAVSSQVIFIAAKLEAALPIDVTQIARNVLKRIGYTDPDFNEQTVSIVTTLSDMSEQTWHRFDERRLNEESFDDIIARNQVTQFGFACDETPVLMPMPIYLAHKMARRVTLARKELGLGYLNPDGKVQVGIEYDKGRPKRIHSLAVLNGFKEGYAEHNRLIEEVHESAVLPIFSDEPLKPDSQTRFYINPYLLSGTGGPMQHAGLTGRKNGIDTYGEYSRHSGSAFSGKGPTRIDRVSAYAARHAAKNIVAAKLARRCEIQLSYTIGQPSPVSIVVNTFGTGTVEEERLEALVREHFDFRLAAILKTFDLRRQPLHHPEGFYEKLACYGHVGRVDMELPWEKADKAEVLKEDAGQSRSPRFAFKGLSRRRG